MKQNKASAWFSHPDYRIEIDQIDTGISVVIDGEIILESEQVLLLSEQDHEPVYYFPRDAIRMALLHKINKTTFCPYKGDAIHWSLKLKNREIKIAAWSYEAPFEQVAKIKNHIAFYPDVVEFFKIKN